MAFDTFISYQARQQPTGSAVITPTGSMSFAELDMMVNRFAGAIAALDIAPGTICAVQIDNPITQWIVVLALARLNLASACAEDVAAALRITNRPSVDTGVFHASDEWVQMVSTSPPASRPTTECDSGLPGRVLLSSGTTGTQKRIGLSWEMIDRNIRNAVLAYGPVGRGPWLFGMGIDSVFGFTVTLAAWAAGHAMLFLMGTDLARALTRFRPALLGMIPLQLQLTLQGLPAGFQPIETMRVVLAGGLLPPSLARAARHRLTPDVRIVYGATECGAATIADARLLDRHPGAVGYAMPGVTIEIVDDAGDVVDRGERGEIRIRSDRVAACYLGSSDDARSALRDGWFRPGDLGRLVEDGLLLIEGRVDEVMNLGGVKLLPASVEALLLNCPGIADLAVFAVPDPAGAARCVVGVVVAAGFDRDAVSAAVTSRLPVRPSVYLMFLDVIPRNEMGKVQRPKLVEMASAAASSGQHPKLVSPFPQ